MAQTPSRRVIPADHATYLFDAAAPAALSVDAPARLTVRARDAYAGACDDLDVDAYLRQRVPGRMNPCTGPIGVRGAKPGDTLQVDIRHVRVGARGYVAATPGLGLMADAAVPTAIEPFDIVGDEVHFGGDLRLPLRVMVGTIGVAPAAGAIETLSLGVHGGNLDFNDIAAGTTVYLPVRAPEALFGIGDVHATMGDGEAHSGVNISAEIDLDLTLRTDEPLAWPWFETARQIMTVGVAGDLEGALKIAIGNMEQLLARRLDVSPTRARMLSGAAVDLRLGQAGGYGVPVSGYAAFPKSALVRAR